MKKLLSLLVGVMLVGGFSLCMADGEINPIPPGGDVINIATIEAVTGTITLREGWNLVAMPVLPSEPYTVERFINDAETKPVWPRVREFKEGDPYFCPPPFIIRCKVPVVAVYKNGQFERYPKEGVTYNMVPGEAYFVYAEFYVPESVPPEVKPDMSIYSHTISIAGKSLDVPVSLDLNRGWNGVSILGELGIGVDRFSKELAEQNIKAIRIALWSAQKQEWEQYELPWQPEPKGDVIMIPMIPANCGFFLLCEENGLYIPGLNTSVEPPVPPFPEPIVSYTGKLVVMADAPCAFWLGCADGTNVPLKGKDSEIDLAIAKAANECGKEFTVKGSFAIVELINPWTGEPVKMEVLVVNEIIPASVRVSYTGKVESVEAFPAPYIFQLRTTDGNLIPLQAVNDDVYALLKRATAGGVYTVGGVFKVILGTSPYPTFAPVKVKVLLVDTVKPANERVSYTGRIEHIASIPEGPYPPSGIALVMDGNPDWIYLRGINDAINEQLNSAASDHAVYTVEGVMETVTYETGQVAYNFDGGEYHVTTTTDMLLVDTVIRLGFLQ